MVAVRPPLDPTVDAWAETLGVDFGDDSVGIPCSFSSTYYSKGKKEANKAFWFPYATRLVSLNTSPLPPSLFPLWSFVSASDLTSLFQPSNLLANTSPSTSLNPPLFSTPPPSPDPTARPPPVQVVSSFVDPIGGLPKKDEAFPGGYPSPKKGKGKGKGGKEKKLRTGRSLNAGTV